MPYSLYLFLLAVSAFYFFYSVVCSLAQWTQLSKKKSGRENLHVIKRVLHFWCVGVISGLAVFGTIHIKEEADKIDFSNLLEKNAGEISPTGASISNQRAEQ
ncbi:hypothetical protein PsW64_00089 [Pseudovibrio sp. W64]|uniref:hypothetical protein n=1 Tax=unclassified Pseudovibrio TaxID=2627060 RepID=UPI0007AEE3A4|nr:MULTISPECIES: hypothetical protein [unclassified Pseudovibrio]KZK91759.1 hypothetical protein PsW64_00089 [Pseudovibrio sp. W64]KZL26893.1 hypothetical protein PsAD37_01566 [Pseudovibrio sp. Ad37]